MAIIIDTADAPAALGPYSQAVVAGALVFVSGQIGVVPETGLLIADDIEQQIAQVFANLNAIVAAVPATLNQVVKYTVYLTNLDDFTAVNQWMQTHLQPPYPARACVEVAALPKGARVEVDAVLSRADI